MFADALNGVTTEPPGRESKLRQQGRMARSIASRKTRFESFGSSNITGDT
jgi:hypothetical protein